MGREQKRKEIKRKKNIHVAEHKIKMRTSKDKIKIAGQIFGILLAGLIMVYWLVGPFLTDDLLGSDKKKEEPKKVAIDMYHILASDIFKVKDSKYYVYCYDFNNSNSNIESLISSEHSSDFIYRVDTNSSYNANYVGSPSNTNVTNTSNIKINGPTLMQLENGKVVNYIEGNINIINYLNG